MGGREVKTNPGLTQLPMRQRALQDSKTDQVGLARSVPAPFGAC
jgi:hypothetical protein